MLKYMWLNFYVKGNPSQSPMNYSINNHGSFTLFHYHRVFLFVATLTWTWWPGTWTCWPWTRWGTWHTCSITQLSSTVLSLVLVLVWFPIFSVVRRHSGTLVPYHGTTHGTGTTPIPPISGLVGFKDSTKHQTLQAAVQFGIGPLKFQF